MTIVNGDRKKKAAGIGVLIALALALWARAKARAQLPPIQYTCPYCGMSFLTQAELDNHIRTNHPTPVPVPAGIAWASIWSYIVIAYCWNANNKCWDRVFEGTTLTSGMECSIMVNQDCVLEYLGLRYELKVEGTGRGAGEGWNIFTWDLPQYYLAE